MPCFDIRRCSCLYDAWRQEREVSFSPTRRRRLSRKCAESSTAYPWQSNWQRVRWRPSELGNTVGRLVSRLELLKLSHRTVAPRHRTLKATLDWSYDLLSDAERIVFRRIAPFVGHFTVEGARFVAGEIGAGAGDIFDAIAGLVEKSLLVSRIDDAQAHYRLLDTTRMYALDKLQEHGEFEPICLRHAEYVIEQLESKKEMLSALPRTERVAACSLQLGNVRSALEWSFGSQGNDEIATRLATVSTGLFIELGLLIEWQAWAEQAITRLGDQDKNSGQGLVRELRLLSGLFLYSSWTTDIYHALDIAARSQKVALKIQDPEDMALAETMLGAANHLAGNHLVAQRHFEAGLHHSASGSRAGHHLFHHTTLSLAGMARSLLYRGLLDQSLDYAKLALEEGEKSGYAGDIVPIPDPDSPGLSGAGGLAEVGELHRAIVRPFRGSRPKAAPGDRNRVPRPVAASSEQRSRRGPVAEEGVGRTRGPTS